MGREIKFRAWDKFKSKMLYDFDQAGAKDWGVKLGESIHTFVWGIGLQYNTLMQFTGMKDKNGREIYEGDVLQIGAVVWRRSGWYVEYHELFDYEADEIEIISNIYESPDLAR